MGSLTATPPASTRPEPGGQEVWRALADPTRRAILDLLRTAPHRTGDLAAAFPDTTRFATMKHLRVLAAAGLILVERRGRERWNRVNPAPIRRIYHRWIRPFEEGTADRLLGLEAHLANEKRRETPMEFRVLDSVQEMELAAPAERVWRALVEETTSWWNLFTQQQPRRMVIEQTIGGRMYEDCGDGAGLLWGTVVGIVPGQKLDVAGELFPAFGGPARLLTTYEVTPLGEDRARLRVRDSGFGAVAESVAGAMADGWQLLFEQGLRPWVEKGERPNQPASVQA